jgi:23S rRNA (cytidine1920-2'-O)/16S rRNA (cytidine1409-2'-O)-methyltransferase
MTTPRQRADQLLVARGLFESRAKAQEAIAAGLVSADGVPVKKPSDTIPETATILAEKAHPWVSRGGIKLAHALDHFGISPEGRNCLDAGASTGGFTQVLLARGARAVIAVDVGRGQLHPDVARDRRVSAREGQDIRTLAAADLPFRPDLLVMDVSFIPLGLVLPAALALLADEAEAVVLIKPQFEVGRKQIGKNGVVKDPAVHEAVCAEAKRLAESLGARVHGIIPSPIAGGEGNREFLMALRRAGAGAEC